jgi:hypothetical protein
LVEALDREGWMRRDAKAATAQRLNACLKEMAEELNQCIALAAAPRRPLLTLILGAGEKAPPQKDVSGPSIPHPSALPARRVSAGR